MGLYGHAWLGGHGFARAIPRAGLRRNRPPWRRPLLEAGSRQKGQRMKVLVCGGRDFEDWNMLSEKLTDLIGPHPIDAIIHGGAPAADAIAGESANVSNIREVVFHADWKKYGRRAGPLRNQRMIDD